MERLTKPNIDIYNSFKVNNYLDSKYVSEDTKWVSAILPRKTRLGLTSIGKYKSPILGKIIKFYINRKNNSLWYYNPSLYSGYQTKDEGGISYFELAGWSEIFGVKELLEKGYSPLKITDALCLYIYEVEKDISTLYEEILLEAITAYNKYLKTIKENGVKVEVKRFNLIPAEREQMNKRVANLTATKNTLVQKVDNKQEINEDIERRFTYHSPKPEDIPKFAELRNTAKELAYLIVKLTPESREQSLALTKLEECIMHANAAIARSK